MLFSYVVQFLSYPPEIRKTNYEVVLNNKDYAASDHPSGVGYGSFICMRLRCVCQESKKEVSGSPGGRCLAHPGGSRVSQINPRNTEPE